MTVTPRVLLTLLAALWLPVCHCQFTTFLLERATCCEAPTKVACHEVEKDCCGRPIPSSAHKQSTHRDSNKTPCAPNNACRCCVTKAPPPSPVSIDLSAVECVLPPSVVEVSDTRHANDLPSISLRQHDPPGPPPGVNERCALMATWLI
ncbi:MAG: hypothetical protein K8R92_04910 [Planctomycetes bacterium]|nr:hypothetical protein [Planctomycetota bacterium]